MDIIKELTVMFYELLKTVIENKVYYISFLFSLFISITWFRIRKLIITNYNDYNRVVSICHSNSINVENPSEEDKQLVEFEYANFLEMTINQYGIEMIIMLIIIFACLITIFNINIIRLNFTFENNNVL